MDYSNIITMEPGRRSGKPCIRGLRVTVYDVLEYVAGGNSREQILSDFPYLTDQDIQACLAFAADRERSYLNSWPPAGNAKLLRKRPRSYNSGGTLGLHAITGGMH